MGAYQNFISSEDAKRSLSEIPNGGLKEIIHSLCLRMERNEEVVMVDLKRSEVPIFEDVRHYETIELIFGLIETAYPDYRLRIFESCQKLEFVRNQKY